MEGMFNPVESQIAFESRTDEMVISLFHYECSIYLESTNAQNCPKPASVVACGITSWLEMMIVNVVPKTLFGIYQRLRIRFVCHLRSILMFME